MAATSLRRPTARLPARGRSAPFDRPRLGALALLAPPLALPILGLSVLALDVPAARFLRGARSAVGVCSSLPMMTLAPSDRLAKPVVTTRSEGVSPLAITASVLVLLRHHDRFRGRDVVVADDIAERSRRTALHRRGRYTTACIRVSTLSRTLTNCPGPELKIGIRKFGLELERAGGRIDLVVDAFQRAGIDDGNPVIAEHVDRQRAFGGCRIDPHDLLLRQG